MKRKITKNRIFLYEPVLTQAAKTLRRDATPAEKGMWEILKNKELDGYKFSRQKPIGTFILDFYCSKLLLGIEVDGDSHDDKEQSDKERTMLLNEAGITILRFSNEEVLCKIDNVKSCILDSIKTLEISSKIVPLSRGI